MSILSISHLKYLGRVLLQDTPNPQPATGGSLALPLGQLLSNILFGTPSTGCRDCPALHVRYWETLRPPRASKREISWLLGPKPVKFSVSERPTLFSNLRSRNTPWHALDWPGVLCSGSVPPSSAPGPTPHSMYYSICYTYIHFYLSPLSSQWFIIHSLLFLKRPLTAVLSYPPCQWKPSPYFLFPLSCLISHYRSVSCYLAKDLMGSNCESFERISEWSVSMWCY